MWGAAWLYKATENAYYLNYLGKNGDAGWAMTEFGWDVKCAGVQTLVAKFLMAGKAGSHTPVLESRVFYVLMSRCVLPSPCKSSWSVILEPMKVKSVYVSCLYQ